MQSLSKREQKKFGQRRLACQGIRGPGADSRECICLESCGKTNDPQGSNPSGRQPNHNCPTAPDQ